MAADPGAARGAGHSLDARALGSLFVAGALIGLTSLILPHSPRADEAGLYLNISIAFAAGVVLLAIGPRLPRWTLHLSLAAGSLLITRAVLLSGDSVSFYSVLYIWVGLYAFYFFSRLVAAAHVGLVAVLFGITLIRMDASSPVVRWLITVATLIVAGVLIDTLVRRARHDADAADANASLMRRLAELAHDLAGLSHSEEARPAVCATVAQVTAAQSVVLWEPADDGTSMKVTASWGREPDRLEIPFAGPPAGVTQAFTSGRRADGPIGGDGSLCVELSGGEARIGSCLWQPIEREQAPVAVLAAYWDDPAAVRSPGQGVLADLLSAEVAVTLERVALLARLELVARTDELTGLPNRRAWQEVLPRELSRAERDSEPLCVVMLDLDHFKDFNDLRGHQAGDRLLKQVAGAWSGALRAGDVLSRYGGEEFALLLPACDIDEAHTVVERLRGVVPLGQTCSAGIACRDQAETAGELIERADRALYEAKRSGRDCSVRASAVASG
jgi:diguanylate cyclase (GGDEF)-like protein